MEIKNLVRSTLNLFHLDLTKNLEYDRLTKAVLKRVIKRNSNCIDVGCHKGEILDLMIKFAPEGFHYAIEPIPDFFEYLKNNYAHHAEVFPYALADKTGTTTFNYVKNAPAYSGIKQRKYDTTAPEIEKIEVEMQTLDNIIREDTHIDFIKIDVEGGEFGVLKGGLEVIKRDKPVIIFEYGLGASDYYGTLPANMYEFVVNDLGLHISLLKSFLNNDLSLSLKEFEECYKSNKEYYFIAYPGAESSF
ncbi:MAG: FkbM family methyltransferase [Bacteroidales bacterium]|nr:FkbM family methyltransferase [Bacteroidales bacterium]MCF8334290.1 FkbM family methyltransferase [Bacteroidales bacterium]